MNYISIKLFKNIGRLGRWWAEEQGSCGWKKHGKHNSKDREKANVASTGRSGHEIRLSRQGPVHTEPQWPWPCSHFAYSKHTGDTIGGLEKARRYNIIKFALWKDHFGWSKENRLDRAREHMYRPVRGCERPGQLIDRSGEIGKMFKMLNQHMLYR